MAISANMASISFITASTSLSSATPVAVFVTGSSTFGFGITFASCGVTGIFSTSFIGVDPDRVGVVTHEFSITAGTVEISPGASDGLSEKEQAERKRREKITRKYFIKEGIKE